MIQEVILIKNISAGITQVKVFIVEQSKGRGRLHAQEMMWLVMGQALTLLLSIASIKMMTSIGTTDYGAFVLITSVTAIFTAVYFGPYEQGYVRYLFDNSDTVQNKSFFLKLFLKGILVRIATLIALALILVLPLAYLFSINKTLTILSIVVILIPLASQTISGMLNGLRCRREVAGLQILEKGFQVCLLLWVVSYGRLYLISVLSVLSITFVVFFIIRILVLLKNIPYRARSGDRNITIRPQKLKKDIHLFMQPFIIWGIFGAIQSNSERWLLGTLLTTSDVGKYGLAISLISATVIVTYTILTQFFTPLIYEYFSNTDKNNVSRGNKFIAIYRWTFIASVVLFSLGFASCGNAIVQLVSSKEYNVGGLFLFFLTAGVGLNLLAEVEKIVGLSRRISDVYVLPKVVVSIISVILYFSACIYAGLEGTAVAVFVVNVIYVVWIIVINKKLHTNQDTQLMNPLC
jgi:O-antigen/teichoic acid export membrane protein